MDVSTRITNVLNSDMSEQDKQKGLIKVHNKILTEIYEIGFDNQTAFNEYLFKNFDYDTRQVITKIVNNSSMIHNDQIYQILSIMLSLHISAQANILINNESIKLISVKNLELMGMLDKKHKTILDNSEGYFQTKQSIIKKDILDHQNEIAKKLDMFEKSITETVDNVKSVVRVEQTKHINELLKQYTDKINPIIKDNLDTAKNINKNLETNLAEFYNNIVEHQTKFNKEMNEQFNEQLKAFLTNLKLWMFLATGVFSSFATLFLYKHLF